MLAKPVEEVREAQTVFDIEAEKPELAVPPDVLQKADVLVKRITKWLLGETNNFILREEARIEAGKPRVELAPEAMGPILASGYQYWNLLTMGPFQFMGNPPYRPRKIVAAGEHCLMLAFLWINPANSDGGGLPGTVVLGDRTYRLRFESMNLTHVTNGPDMTFTGKFDSPAPILTDFRWWMPTADPGINPAHFEVNVTMDITVHGQPFAGFSTWHYDPDAELPWLQIPVAPAHWQFERPARMLIYRK